jgi:hypothetical protein
MHALCLACPMPFEMPSTKKLYENGKMKIEDMKGK